MANKNHLSLLKEQGVQAWNNWRKENPDVIPELEGASLEQQVLKGIDLRKANLREICLRSTNFIEANLTEANLTGANLSDANLTGANPAFLSHDDLSRG